MITSNQLNQLKKVYQYVNTNKLIFASMFVIVMSNIFIYNTLNNKITETKNEIADSNPVELSSNIIHAINSKDSIINVMTENNNQLANEIKTIKYAMVKTTTAAKIAEKVSQTASKKVETLDKKVNNKPIIEYTINREAKTGTVEFKNNGKSILKVTPHARENINNLWRNIYNCKGSIKAKRVCVAMICAEHGIAQENVIVDASGRMFRRNGMTSPQMRNFNYGNIKCHKKGCNHKNCDTAKDDGPRDKFVRYANAKAGLQAMLDFIQNGRYAPLWKKSKNDEVDIITGIDALGYATANYKELVVPYYTILKDYK